MGLHWATLLVMALVVIAIIGAVYWLLRMPIERYSGWSTSLRIPYRLANGEVVMVYPGEEIIDNTKGNDMGKQFEIYVDGAHIGSVDKETFKQVSKEANPLAFTVDITHMLDRTNVLYHSGGRAPQIIRRVIGIIDGEKQPTLKDAAQAFEKAINSEPGIEAEIRGVEARSMDDLHPRTLYTVVISQTKRLQVYP